MRCSLRDLPLSIACLVIVLPLALSGWRINPSKQLIPEIPILLTRFQSNRTSNHDEICLSCHQGDYLFGEFEDQTQILLSLDKIDFEQPHHDSIKLECVNCHKNLDANEHQQKILHAYPDCYQLEDRTIRISCSRLQTQLPFSDERAMAIELSAFCSTCHTEENTISVDNVHLRMLEQGNPFAPICVDCHGSHAIRSYADNRTQIAMLCANCHLAVYSSYRLSVHGAALDAVSNPDVPTCIDCHGAHNIQGPRQMVFRDNSVNICEGCHGNKELMDKYEISVEIFQTYLSDVHIGTQTIFDLDQRQEAGSNAVCFDCHGIHNIRKTDDPLSAVSEVNIQTTCRQCHDENVNQFPSIWLSHYPPNLDKNPGWALVFWSTRIIVSVGLGGFLLFVIWNEGARWLARRQINIES